MSEHYTKIDIQAKYNLVNSVPKLKRGIENEMKKLLSLFGGEERGGELSHS